MNLDEMKITWKAYDEKLKTTSLLQERLIVSMIADRSGSRVETVKRKYFFGILWMLLCLGVGIAILLSNPFDYAHKIQYAPIAIFDICLTIMTIKQILTYRNLNSIMVTHNNIREALTQVVRIYEQPHRFLKYTIILFLTQGVIFPLTFLPRVIDRMGLWPALAERMIPIAISGLILFGAHKLGLFKDKEEKKFRQDIEELNELKALTKELGRES